MSNKDIFKSKLPQSDENTTNKNKDVKLVGPPKPLEKNPDP